MGDFFSWTNCMRFCHQQDSPSKFWVNSQIPASTSPNWPKNTWRTRPPNGCAGIEKTECTAFYAWWLNHFHILRKTENFMRYWTLHYFIFNWISLNCIPEKNYLATWHVLQYTLLYIVYMPSYPGNTDSIFCECSQCNKFF